MVDLAEGGRVQEPQDGFHGAEGQELAVRRQGHGLDEILIPPCQPLLAGVRVHEPERQVLAARVGGQGLAIRREGDLPDVGGEA